MHFRAKISPNPFSAGDPAEELVNTTFPGPYLAEERDTLSPPLSFSGVKLSSGARAMWSA